MLKVGLVGAGLIGQVHARAYGNLPDAKLAAVADIRPERVAAVAEQYGASAVRDAGRAARRRLDVDVIDVCLPTPLHASHTIRALQAGKHVFCEKPVARTMDEARQVQEAAAPRPGQSSPSAMSCASSPNTSARTT